MRTTAIILILIVVPVAGAVELKCPQLDVTGFPNITAYIHVLDNKGEAVVGLNRSNFEIYEDGAPIHNFAVTATYHGSEFLSAVLVVDISGSMKGEPWVRVKEAASGFLGRLSVNDQIALLPFHERVGPAVPFTSGVHKLESALAALQPKRDTALYDAILAGIQLYDGFEASRRAIILLTDGKDTHSRNKPEQVLSRVQTAGIPIYTIGLGKTVKIKLLTQFADASGGSYFPAATPNELLRIYRQIAGRLQNQYRITYRTKVPMGQSWHTLNATVKYDGQGTFLTHSFLANPNPMVHGIVLQHPFLNSGWVPTLIGGVLGLLLALVYAIMFRLRGIGNLRHRVLVICIGVAFGLGCGAFYGFWLM